tara:strand:+ start:9352 stop:9918 length:567 start_codon:yes stop_codon:yes gene_type:complete
MNSKIPDTASKRTITALVQDKPGVLNRVASMFRRRGFNIESLAVGKSEESDLSRMTFVVDGDDRTVEQVTKHLHKLIDVIKVSDISDQNIVSRELALIRVKVNIQTRAEVMQVVGLFRANIIDVAPDSLIVEVVGDEDKIDSLHELLKEFGVVEVMRTGTIALNRGLEAAKKESRKSKHRNWGEAASV